MQAVVLVGGEGTRLRPLTATVPKQMLPIVEVTMIERVLRHLADHGIEEAILSLGYLPTAFRDAFPNSVIAGVKVSYAIEPEPLDTAGAISFAAHHGGVEDTFLVINGDILSDLDIGRLLDFHRSHEAEGTIHLHPVSDPSAFGVVPTDQNGAVIKFVEKPPRDEAPTNMINAGTYVLETSFLKRVPLGHRMSIEREIFPAMAKDKALYACVDDSYWLDTGTATHFLQANKDFLSMLRKDVFGHGRGSYRDGNYLATNAQIDPGAKVNGSVISTGCVIEDGAIISDSVLFGGARVAMGSKVAGSIVGATATVGERCSIDEVSIVGYGVVVSSGTHIQGARIPA